MNVARTIQEVRAYRERARSRGSHVGLVPTMGALHEGHLSLVRMAREKCKTVVVSIFVNPTQFGPNEDFARYPRDLEHDLALLEREKVDLAFVPTVKEMYPEPVVTWIMVEGLSDRLCGKSRLGHFRGVATVVAKLFNIVEPDMAFFGQKDAAQVAIIKRMVHDLDFPAEIEVGPIVREVDGLAMSSRNAYLTAEQRTQALVLFRSLGRTKDLLTAGERNVAALIEVAKEELARVPEVRLDYFEIVDPDELTPVATITKPALAAVAAFAGNTRLIDNILLEP